MKDKWTAGVSVEEIEHFARKYTTEAFTVLAVIVAAVSSAFHFFTGPHWAIFFLALGTVVGVLLPNQADRWLKKFYTFTGKQQKPTQIGIGAMKIVIGLFVPFLLFGCVEVLAGTAYHYYIQHGAKQHQ